MLIPGDAGQVLRKFTSGEGAACRSRRNRHPRGSHLTAGDEELDTATILGASRRCEYALIEQAFLTGGYAHFVFLWRRSWSHRRRVDLPPGAEAISPLSRPVGQHLKQPFVRENRSEDTARRPRVGEELRLPLTGRGWSTNRSSTNCINR